MPNDIEKQLEEAAKGPEMVEHVIDLACRFCSAVTGHHKIKLEKGAAVPTADQLGYADSRCDACIEQHGEYGHLTRIIDRDVSHDPAVIADIMNRGEGKAEKVLEILYTEHPETTVANGYDKQFDPRFKKHMDKLEKAFGIDKEQPVIKILAMAELKQKHPGLSAAQRKTKIAACITAAKTKHAQFEQEKLSRPQEAEK